MSQPNHAGAVNLGRRQSQCSICSSPYRQQIEREWINWTYPGQLERLYDISRDALCRHAHAFDLSSKRRDNVSLVLQQMIEQVDVVQLSGSAILSAIQLLLNLEIEKDGERTPRLRTHGSYQSTRHLRQLIKIADGGSLPEPLSGAEAATSDDSQDGEEEA